VTGVRRESSNSSLTTVPRGPPRKPKQSGHALWVGNLPPGATVLDLKDHFSRDATKDIESLFLISKSNCGFVNYRTEEACAAAMQRFHDSRFQGVRLVCRLRRTSTPSPAAAPTGPSVGAEAVSATRRLSTASTSRSPTRDGSKETDEHETQAENTKLDDESTGSARVPEKFFVVKSLTLQDLEQSVRNGIWATQAHNEQALNKAFEVS
jgi:RNA recognition motif-containing protein